MTTVTREDQDYYNFITDKEAAEANDSNELDKYWLTTDEEDRGTEIIDLAGDDLNARPSPK